MKLHRVHCNRPAQAVCRWLMSARVVSNSPQTFSPEAILVQIVRWVKAPAFHRAWRGQSHLLLYMRVRFLPHCVVQFTDSELWILVVQPITMSLPPNEFRCRPGTMIMAAISFPTLTSTVFNKTGGFNVVPAFPDHTRTDLIAKLKQSLSRRRLQTDNVVNLNFCLCGWIPWKWIPWLRQEDISGILWACQAWTERYVSKTIFVSL